MGMDFRVSKVAEVVAMPGKSRFLGGCAARNDGAFGRIRAGGIGRPDPYPLS
jgi:hypothetical protein